MANRSRVRLIVTPGDPDGIGPEIVSKTLHQTRLPPQCEVLCIGASKPFESQGARLHLVSEKELSNLLKQDLPEAVKGDLIWFYSAPTSVKKKNLFLQGFQAGWSIQQAVQLIQKGLADGLVTGPIHKERFQKGGFRFEGHTEFLAKLSGVRDVTMMLANSYLRISLVTIHLPLKAVSRHLTRKNLRKTILQTAEGLKTLWQFSKPRIAVCALNPHGGENGIFGDEEKKILIPEIQFLKRKHARLFDLEGPFPADTLFTQFRPPKTSPPSYVRLPYDAVICLYHDQGLIPVKLLDFPQTVNITLGLPFIRTSVDHGVAFDIVGQNKADPSSFQSALWLAYEFAQKRKTTQSLPISEKRAESLWL